MDILRTLGRRLLAAGRPACCFAPRRFGLAGPQRAARTRAWRPHLWPPRASTICWPRPPTNTPTATPTTQPGADLILRKESLVHDPIAPGSLISYTVVVSNTGPLLAASVVVTDDLPAARGVRVLHGLDRRVPARRLWAAQRCAALGDR